jgi:hypothetical protein
MPDWRDEVGGAVRAWLGTIQSGVRTPTWRPIGTARPEGQGWFVVDLRGAQQTQTRLEELETLRISRERPTGATGSGDIGYRVLDAVLQGEILRVQVAAHVAEHDLRLWALKLCASVSAWLGYRAFRSCPPDHGAQRHALEHYQITRLTPPSITIVCPVM